MMWMIAFNGTLSAAFADPEVSDDLGDSVDPDNKPDAPTVDLPDPGEDTKALAGVGSAVGYARRATVEAGGAMSFSLSNEAATLSADPMVGYFLFDNVQMSAIVGVRHVAVDGEHLNQFSAVLEPSLHVPINDGLFWFAGLGAGLALADNVDDDPQLEAGLAVAPRAGIPAADRTIGPAQRRAPVRGGVLEPAGERSGRPGPGGPRLRQHLRRPGRVHGDVLIPVPPCSPRNQHPPGDPEPC